MSNNEVKSLLTTAYKTEFMLAMEEILREFETLPVEVIKNFWNPEKCRADLLPYLATYLGVNSWDSSWSEKQKRAVCASALIVNKQKGTLKSLKEALKSLNLNVTIVEWWHGQLPKGTAVINLHEKDIIYSDEQFKAIYRLVDEVKRLSLLISFKKTNSISGSVNVGGGVLISKRTYIE